MKVEKGILLVLSKTELKEAIASYMQNKYPQEYIDHIIHNNIESIEIEDDNVIVDIDGFIEEWR